MKAQKFKSAETKRAHEENVRSWEELEKRCEPKTIDRESRGFTHRLENPPSRERLDVPSRSTPGGTANFNGSLRYTRNQMVGITIVHKSCLQPVFQSGRG